MRSATLYVVFAFFISSISVAVRAGHCSSRERHSPSSSLVFRVTSCDVGQDRLSPLRATTTVQLNVPPRYMWGWGPGVNGYCGETSFQSHGILFGNWISAEEVRASGGGKELLIGVNDVSTAEDLLFDYEEWGGTKSARRVKGIPLKSPQLNATSYVSWVVKHVDQGHVVVSGWFEKLPSSQADSDYDHIMPTIGYKKDSSSGAILGLIYNDLWGTQPRYADLSTAVTTRSNCLTTTKPTQPYDYCIPSSNVYAIALTGNVDQNSETVPMTLTMPSWKEPDWGKEDGLHEKAVQFTVTATVSGLTSGKQYSVLRYDDQRNVPISGFLDSSFSERFDFTAQGATQELTDFDSFMSDATIFYRVVPSA